LANHSLIMIVTVAKFNLPSAPVITYYTPNVERSSIKGR